MAQTSFRQLQQELQDVAARGTDPRPVLKEVADSLRLDFRQGFGKNRWAPLDPEYAARKARQGRSRRVGVFTGGMLASLTSEGSRYHFEDITREGLKVGTKNPVARLFDKGRSGQPKRDLVKIKPAQRRSYLQRVQAYLVDGDL